MRYANSIANIWNLVSVITLNCFETSTLHAGWSFLLHLWLTLRQTERFNTLPLFTEKIMSPNDRAFWKLLYSRVSSSSKLRNNSACIATYHVFRCTQHLPLSDTLCSNHTVIDLQVQKLPYKSITLMIHLLAMQHFLKIIIHLTLFLGFYSTCLNKTIL